MSRALSFCRTTVIPWLVLLSGVVLSCSDGDTAVPSNAGSGGVSGTSGTAGGAGYSAVAGTSGTSGTGTAGSAGAVLAGSAGSSGVSGASAGESGSSGTSGAGGTTLPTMQQWLLDGDIWTEAPELAFYKPWCTGFLAPKDKLQFPPIQWESCGDGCERSDIVQSYGTWMSLPSLSTLVYDGAERVVVSGSLLVKSSPTKHLRLLRMIDLTNGDTLAAAKADYDPNVTGEYIKCEALPSIESAVFTTFVGGADSTGTGNHILNARPDLATGLWRMAVPDVLLSENHPTLRPLDIDVNGGKLLYVGGGAVFLLDDFSQNSWTTLESPSTSYRGAGDGDLAAWYDAVEVSESEIARRVRVWSPGGSITTLVQGFPGNPVDLAISPTRIVLLQIDSLEESTLDPGIFFWHSARGKTPAETNFVKGPVLHAPNVALSASFPRTWGDYATVELQTTKPAGNGYITDQRFLLVSQLSTGKMWKLVPQPGKKWNGSTLTLSSTHLYVAEVNDNTDLTAQQVVRIDLSKLDSLGEVLP